MEIPPPGKGIPRKLRPWLEQLRQLILSGQGASGRNTSIDVHPGKGTVYNAVNRCCTGGEPGACCIDGVCSIVGSETECTDLGGTFQGVGTTCETSICVGCCWACNSPNVSDFASCESSNVNNCHQFYPGDSECDDCETTHGSASLTVTGTISGFFKQAYDCFEYDGEGCNESPEPHFCTVSFEATIDKTIGVTTNIFCDGSIFLNGDSVTDLISPDDFVTDCSCDECPYDVVHDCGGAPTPDCSDPEGYITGVGSASLGCFGHRGQWTVQGDLHIPLPDGGFKNVTSPVECCGIPPEEGCDNVACLQSITCNETSGTISFSSVITYDTGEVEYDLTFTVA